MALGQIEDEIQIVKAGVVRLDLEAHGDLAGPVNGRRDPGEGEHLGEAAGIGMQPH
ncbi:hypothetical protein [Xanthobacter flavus]|uniref:hypothetical protein n=1 Tax=Xanthobacter flavus TaxID=281 RepID=UPI0032AF8135